VATTADAAFPGANGKIAFVRAGNLMDASTNGVYVMNADGSGQSRLLGSASDPAWSADGRRIAFESMPIRQAEIYTANADGSARKRLTNTSDVNRLAGCETVRRK
jgi:TolB protein